jgi:hypothetical protein
MSIIDTYPVEQAPGFPEERFRLGEIYAEKELAPSEVGIPDELAPRLIRQVEVSDPYLWDLAVRKPEAIEDMRRIENETEQMAARRLEAGLWKRSPKTAYFNEQGEEVQKDAGEFGDPVTADWLFTSPEGLNSPLLKKWKKLIPSAKALMYLSDPTGVTELVTAEGERIDIPEDDPARERWITCVEAVNIRGRAVVMSEKVVEYVEQHPEKREYLRWMSVACGTALPAMQGAIRAEVKTSDLSLLDLDKDAMDSTMALAAEIHYSGSISQRRLNIFNPKRMAALREELTAGDVDMRPDVVDAMGIFEYTGEELGVDPVEFLRSVWGLLKPGGRLIFGQMDKNRPVPNFTMGGIQWPYVSMRSPAEVMKMMKEAGIPLDRVTLTMQENGVYMVLTGDKPEEEALEAGDTAAPQVVDEVDVVTHAITGETFNAARTRRVRYHGLAHRAGAVLRNAIHHK